MTTNQGQNRPLHSSSPPIEDIDESPPNSLQQASSEIHSSHQTHDRSSHPLYPSNNQSSNYSPHSDNPMNTSRSSHSPSTLPPNATIDPRVNHHNQQVTNPAQPTTPTRLQHQNNTVSPPITSIQINPHVNLAPPSVVTSQHSILEHTSSAVFKPYKTPLRNTTSLPTLGSSPTSGKSLYGGVGVSTLGGRRRMVKRDGSKGDLMGLEEEVEVDMGAGKCMEAGKKGDLAEDHQGKKDDLLEGQQGNKDLTMRPATETRNTTHTKEVSANQGAGGGVYRAVGRNEGGQMLGRHFVGGFEEEYTNLTHHEVHHDQLDQAPIDPINPINTHPTHESRYSSRPQQITSHNQTSNLPQELRTQPSIDSRHVDRHNRQQNNQYQPSYERRGQVETEQGRNEQYDGQQRVRYNEERNQQGGMQYQPAPSSSVIQANRQTAQPSLTKHQSNQYDQYPTANRNPTTQAYQQVPKSHNPHAQQPSIGRGQYASPNQYAQPNQQASKLPQQYTQNPQRQDQLTPQYNQNAQVPRGSMHAPTHNATSYNAPRAVQPQEFSSYPDLPADRRQASSKPASVQQPEKAKQVETVKTPIKQTNEHAQEKNATGDAMEVDEPAPPFDPTAPVPKYDSQTELVQKWDKIQAELEPVLKGICDDVLTSTYDIIYGMLHQFQTINTEAQANLRAGVTSIEAEEEKHEEAKKVITAFSEEMQRVAEVLGKFGMNNIGFPFQR